MLHDLHRGRPGSERAGAEGAKRQVCPAWAALIDAAWATRPDLETFARTPECLELVLAEAEAAAVRPSRMPNRSVLRTPEEPLRSGQRGVRAVAKRGPEINVSRRRIRTANETPAT